jgi:aminoglycoside phosphotransferase (APT) family kinase protein
MYRSTMQSYEDITVVEDVIRQILPDRTPLIIERVPEGKSTAVYRIHGNEAIYYFRVLPEIEASFTPEAYVHTTLRTWGLHLPEVLYFEPYNANLQRSIMLTTAIAGQAIGQGVRPLQADQVVRRAGAELASLNNLPVQGFGWVQRPAEVREGLSAEYPTYQAWLNQDFDPPLWALQQSALFSSQDYQALRIFMAEAVEVFGSEPATLAHGDFDTTHTYHHEGQYTGIIDFGEIRGAQQLYDVGHFWIENSDLLSPLLEGYAEVAPLPADHQRRIYLTGLLIAARRLGRSLSKQAGVYRPDVKAIQSALSALEA